MRCSWSKSLERPWSLQLLQRDLHWRLQGLTLTDEVRVHEVLELGLHLLQELLTQLLEVGRRLDVAATVGVAAPPTSTTTACVPRRQL